MAVETILFKVKKEASNNKTESMDLPSNNDAATSQVQRTGQIPADIPTQGTIPAQEAILGIFDCHFTLLAIGHTSGVLNIMCAK